MVNENIEVYRENILSANTTMYAIVSVEQIACKIWSFCFPLKYVDIQKYKWIANIYYLYSIVFASGKTPNILSNNVSKEQNAIEILK